MADRFAGSDLEVRLVDGGAGRASAVKMCFAAWTKGTSALLLAVRTLADAAGVDESLLAEWATSMSGLDDRSRSIAAGVGPKAWRFEGEMHQIANSFDDAGLPPGFHLAAAELYSRMADLKGRAPTGSDSVTLDEAVNLLLRE